MLIFAEPDRRSTDSRRILSRCTLTLAPCMMAMILAMEDVVNCWDSTFIHAAAHATPPSHVRLYKTATTGERCHRKPNVRSNREKKLLVRTETMADWRSSEGNVTLVHVSMKYPSRSDTIKRSAITITNRRVTITPPSRAYYQCVMACILSCTTDERSTADLKHSREASRSCCHP